MWSSDGETSIGKGYPVRGGNEGVVGEEKRGWIGGEGIKEWRRARSWWGRQTCYSCWPQILCYAPSFPLPLTASFPSLQSLPRQPHSFSQPSHLHRKKTSLSFFFFFFLIIDHLHTLSHTVSSSPSLLTSFTNLSHHPNHHHHPLTTATTGYSGVSPFSFPYKYLRKG